MKIADAMHRKADWASADTPITEIAQMMEKDDIGAIPVGKDDKPFARKSTACLMTLAMAFSVAAIR